MLSCMPLRPRSGPITALRKTPRRPPPHRGHLPHRETAGLSFAVNIGDLVDMRAAQTSLGAHGSLDRVLSLLRNSTALPWHFALGNHDVANFKYNELQRFLKLNATGTVPPGARAAYSAFSPAPGERLQPPPSAQCRRVGALP